MTDPTQDPAYAATMAGLQREADTENAYEIFIYTQGCKNADQNGVARPAAIALVKPEASLDPTGTFVHYDLGFDRYYELPTPPKPKKPTDAVGNLISGKLYAYVAGVVTPVQGMTYKNARGTFRIVGSVTLFGFKPSGWTLISAAKK